MSWDKENAKRKRTAPPPRERKVTLSEAKERHDVSLPSLWASSALWRGRFHGPSLTVNRETNTITKESYPIKNLNTPVRTSSKNDVWVWGNSRCHHWCLLCRALPMRDREKENRSGGEEEVKIHLKRALNDWVVLFFRCREIPEPNGTIKRGRVYIILLRGMEKGSLHK